MNKSAVQMQQQRYTQDEFVLRQRAYLEAIAPISKVMADYLSFQLPTMFIYPDGKIEYKWSLEAEKKLDEFREMIREIQKYFKLELEP
jgi:hypothetical protein